MSALADVIVRGILAERPAGPALAQCLFCGRAFMPGKGGANGRFCHCLCVEAYDAGYVFRDGGLYVNHGQAGSLYGLPVRGEGFLIDCRHCRRPFVSKGLRCCCPDHERQHREREEIAATMAEVGMESAPKRFLTCQQCGIAIPRWRNGKTVPKNTRFCGRKCADKAARVAKSRQAGFAG